MVSRRPCIVLSFWLGGLLLSLPCGGAAQDAYERAMERSQLLESEGQQAEAARVLEVVAPLYPDDYLLFLQLGWLHFSAGDLQAAERHYRRAAALSEREPEAVLGVGYALLRQDRIDEALAAFDEVLARRPEDRRAQEGKQLAAAALDAGLPLAMHATVLSTYHRYGEHPTKDWAIGISPTLTAIYTDRLALSATYRYSRFSAFEERRGHARALGNDASFEQHEIYGTLGYGGARLGLSAHYAYVGDTTAALSSAHVLGATGRASVFGDLILETSVSFYEEGRVLRIAPSWTLPLSRVVALAPRAAIQHVDDGIHLSGGLSLLVTGEIGSLSVGSRIGSEWRPAYLDVPAVYNTADEIVGALSISGRLVVSPSVALYGAYEVQRLEAAAETGHVTASAHYVSLGLGVSP